MFTRSPHSFLFMAPFMQLRTRTFSSIKKQESRAFTRKPRHAAAVVFGLKFADNIHYKFKSSQASKARLHSSKRIGGEEHLMQNGHSRTTFFQVSGKAVRD